MCVCVCVCVCVRACERTRQAGRMAAMDCPAKRESDSVTRSCAHDIMPYLSQNKLYIISGG